MTRIEAYVGSVGWWAILSLSVSAQTGSIQGFVVDAATGDPLPGASISIPGTTRGAISDIDGYYFISKLPYGSYHVEAHSIGFANSQPQQVDVLAEGSGTLTFRLLPYAEIIHRVQLAMIGILTRPLSPMALISASPRFTAATIRGLVRDARTGSPLVGSAIYVPELDRFTLTTEDGTFLLENLPFGQVTVRIAYPSYQTYRWEGTLRSGTLLTLLPPMQKGPLSRNDYAATMPGWFADIYASPVLSKYPYESIRLYGNSLNKLALPR